ncbi:MAG: sialate O-acetylesterase [Akkermansiaceae bacterium]
MLLLSLFLSSEQLPADQAGDSPVKIFIMVGQSNMLGHGNMAPATTEGTLEYIVVPANDPGGDYQFLVNGAAWAVRDDVWIRDQNGALGGLTAGYGANSGTVGPELGFGHHAGDLYDKQIIIVKAAWGGKDLANDFRPPSSGGTTGFYYHEILRLVNEMLDDLNLNSSTYFPDYDTAGGFEIAGFCWHQGYNDRIDVGRSAEYQVNMANFIKDIRSSEHGLGVPNLPFVIATTGMGGDPTYTVVEQAQLAMADAVTYPEFVGNVAVIDTRMPYNGLQFWYPVANSPANQGYHWNRNAKTYVNIGLAMGDAMSTLSPARCPSRVRANTSPNGVTLTWQNGTELPTSVRILRNSVEIASAAPVNPASFTDTGATPGVLDYELQFTMPGDPCDPLIVSFDAGITGLEAYRSPGGIALTWTNNLAYTAIELRRNGVLLESALSGTATTYTDATPPASGLVTYSVVPTNGSAAPTEIQINMDGPPSGNAVIYEPFDYTVGGLNGQGGSEAGLSGNWFANSTTLVTAGTLSYNGLPVGGAKLSDFTNSQNRFGGSRDILPAALAANGLLDGGATLWFSFITGLQNDANRTNSRLAVALSAGPFGSGNGDFFISGGTGVGFYMGAGIPRAASFPANSGGAIQATNNTPQYQVGSNDLIVGKITWGATAGDLDTIELFKPDTDLVLPATPISTLTTTVDQSTFDTLTFRRGDKPVLDEIRFGISYNDVIGADLVGPPDTEAPNPDPLTWETVPKAAGDSQITMTATTAMDPGGVEYYFEERSGNPGGSDSGWQNSPTYTDTGLNSTTSYSYRVKARDKSANANETDWSSTEAATTTTPDNTPPTPAQMSFASAPVAISTTEISMVAATASDPSGVEYYFTETSGNPGGDDSGWQDSPNYVDTGLSPSTAYSYTVTARDKSSAANENTVSAEVIATTPDLPSGPGGALLYEPFDYDTENVSGNNGGTGFGAAWSNTRGGPTVNATGKIWGALTTAGGHARGNAWSGLIRPVGSTLADAGLMANGVTLWFSVILDLDSQNTSNADISVALGTDQFVSGTFGDRENLVDGEGIGVTHSGGTVQGVYWQDNDADTIAERNENNSSTVINGSGGNSTRALIVGKIEWGAGNGDSETLTLYAPDTNLTQGTPTMAAWAIPALNQSLFDSLAIQFKDNSQVDEIRFGATYEDVVGLGGTTDYDDWAGLYVGDLTDPTADLDGDGMSNEDERIWGLDPTSASSLNPYAVPLAADGTFSYTRRDTSLSNLTYTVWTSPNLQPGSWVQDTGASQSPGDPDVNDVETVAVTLSATAIDGRLFVRIQAAE